MKNYTIEYLSYEGNIRVIECEGENEDDAISNAYDAEGNYSGDNIQKIISIVEN